MAESVCPWWAGYLLASPIRKLMQDPEKLLHPHVKPGMRALDAGCAMGFFSLPMARIAGTSGRVVCVDLQEKMINSLKRRATRAGLVGRMEFRVCSPGSLMIDDLAGSIDFALAFAVVHETPDPGKFFAEIGNALRKGGHLLLAEPAGHVSADAFQKTLSLARNSGFHTGELPAVWKSYSCVLIKD
jgi:ubiquinone/menaquinone biosynthesis C-methylase UbiE